MNWFGNAKIGYKLCFLLLIAFIALGVISLNGYTLQQKLYNDMNHMYDNQLRPLDLAGEARTFVRTMNGAVLQLMLSKDQAKNNELKQLMEDRAKKAQDNLAALEQCSLDAKAREMLQQVKESSQQYNEVRDRVVGLAMQNKNEEAYALYTSKLEVQANALADNLRGLSQYLSKSAAEVNADDKNDFRVANMITFGINVVCFLLLGGIGYFITKMITRPIGKMVAACRALAEGDFRDKPRGVTSRDEMGQLADAMADMRTNIRKLMKQVSHSSEQVAASSEQLTASAGQASEAANQVAQSITDVSKNAEQQLRATDESTVIVQAMSESVQQVAFNSNEAVQKSVTAAERAKDGGEAAGKAIEQMGRIETKVEVAAAAVNKLNEKSKRIGEIVDTIAGIAGQTNLLALNAAIEAARAGEQGRGFAVVAEEVRKLAEESQSAAKTIAELINEIQTDTSETVGAMVEGSNEIRLGTEVVNSAGQTFQEITTLVTEVSKKVQDITKATEPMAKGSQQMVDVVQQLGKVGKTTAGQAQEVSAATEEQSASTEEIAAASQELARLAQDLQVAVSQFKV